MELIIVIEAVGLLLNLGVAVVATSDIHWCAGGCNSTGSTDTGMVQTSGKKTLRNVRGVYYTHNHCVKK